MLLTNSIYVYNTHQFIPAEDSSVTTNYVDKGIQPMPEFRLQTTNRLQVFMLDQDSFGNYHLIDYVQFAGPEGNRNLNSEIADYDPTQPNVGLWNTNFFGMSALPYALPNGVVNQVYYAIDPVQYAYLLTSNDSGKWIRAQDDSGVSSVAGAVANLNAFLNSNHRGKGRDTQGNTATVSNNTNLLVQVPFTPTRVSYQYVSWQANDPLVHYVASDLNFAGPADPNHLQPGIHQFTDPGGTNSLPPNNLGLMNDRYQPWGISLLVTNHGCKCRQSCV